MTSTSPEIRFRVAARHDLPTIIQMLADDPLGQKRENYATPLSEEYLVAFEAINNDKNNEIILACYDEKVIGFFQITYIPYLTYMGKWRALVEGVRVHTAYRNQGVGKKLLLRSIELAKQKGCHLIQLTTDKARPEAIAFYKSLGFVASHEGMKLHF
jgi:ribosomal protein S18 acetylase RimI-like enzyme